MGCMESHKEPVGRGRSPAARSDCQKNNRSPFGRHPQTIALDTLVESAVSYAACLHRLSELPSRDRAGHNTKPRNPACKDETRSLCGSLRGLTSFRKRAFLHYRESGIDSEIAH